MSNYDLKQAQDYIINTSAGVAADIDMAHYLVEHLIGRYVADETPHLNRINYPRRPSNVSHALRGHAVINM
jgi:transcriptional regulator GlxA family with amidase domain